MDNTSSVTSKKPPVGHGKLGVGGATPIGTLREILESWSIFLDSVWCLLMSIINELVRERTSWVFRKPKVTFRDSFGIEFMWQTMAQSTVASPNFDRSQPPLVAGFHKMIDPLQPYKHQSRPWHFHTFPRNGLLIIPTINGSREVY